MKKLITAADVKKLSASGQAVLYVEPGTIITPSAKDLAKEMKITISYETPPEQPSSGINGQVSTTNEALDTKKHTVSSVTKIEDIPPHLIAEIVKKVLDSLPGVPKEPNLVREVDGSGVVLVKGNSVKMEPFDAGNPNLKVGIRETMTRELSPHLAAGFMEMEESAFDWTLTYNEMDYVIEGTLDITVNGKTYRGQAGDVFYIPEGTSVTFSTPDRCKFFYVTTPWPAFL
ncbi:ethanolamine utilization EutQ family protein [Thermincola ferriacetica]|uniref:Ethanolamine utilization EutQ family protein n=1 Tax=Thermincola ferriacetica TaxID=281456 RepID=A0A0L6VZL2_9FIRM|nr:cupin domain-containing protein [Thermincola ferriacetica]KNZ68767.1 ethanolamine utilization EutQ family protein [Thermincola ferriacetica]